MEEFKEVTLAKDQDFYNGLIQGFNMIMRASKINQGQAFTVYFNAAMSMVEDLQIPEERLVQSVKESLEHFKAQKEAKQ
jgi:hypothetical protein